MRLNIPVDPDAETAREWAREELAKPDYTTGTTTNWIERFMDWVWNLISDFGNGVGGGWGGWSGVAIVLIVAAVIALIVWLVVGPLRRSRGRATASDDLGDPSLSADQLLTSASAAARAGNWNLATLEGYRALIRLLAEREIIDARPGMTAFEAAVAASGAIPTIASAVFEDADVFDAVRYGHLDATRAHYEHVLATRASASKARAGVHTVVVEEVPA